MKVRKHDIKYNYVEHFTTSIILQYTHIITYFQYVKPSNICAVILDGLMNWPFKIISSVNDTFLIEWVAVWKCTNIGLILLVFGLSYGPAAKIRSIFSDIGRLHMQLIIYMS